MKKKKEINKIQYITTMAIAIALIIYSVFAIISLIKKPTDTFLVENRQNII